MTKIVAKTLIIKKSGDFNFKECLKDIRQSNLNRSILRQLNINSIRNKFSFFVSQIGNNLDVLLIGETKLDDTFPTAQFLQDGFKKTLQIRSLLKRWWFSPFCQR